MRRHFLACLLLLQIVSSSFLTEMENFPLMMTEEAYMTWRRLSAIQRLKYVVDKRDIVILLGGEINGSILRAENIFSEHLSLLPFAPFLQNLMTL